MPIRDRAAEQKVTEAELQVAKRYLRVFRTLLDREDPDAISVLEAFAFGVDVNENPGGSD